VLIADDEHSYREALAFRLGSEADLEVHEAETPSAAGKLARIDVALIGFADHDNEGAWIALERFLARNRAGAAILVTPRDLAIDYALSLDAGGIGAISRTARLDDIVDCVRRVANREPLAPPEGMVESLVAVQRVKSAVNAINLRAMALTRREHTVLEWMARGYSGPEIARELGIADKTERNHVASILTKLRVNSRLQAVLCAVSVGLVDPPTPLEYWDIGEPPYMVDARQASRVGSKTP
jgi:DNA-binding NarL/FixJ family response regulator